MAGPWEKYSAPADGPWAKYAVPEEKPNEVAPSKASFGDQLKREIYTSAPFALARGVKDVIDTGAQGAAWLADKITGGSAAQQVRAENEAGKQDFAETTKGSYVAPVARVVGNVIGTAPVTSFMGASAGAAGLNRLGQALSTGGASIGKTTGNRLADVLLRSGAGAVSGGVSAGLVDPQDAGTGALIGGALPMVAPVVKTVGTGARKLLGATTGVGDEALAQAYKAGKTGGQAASDFTQNMRGGGSMDDVLAAAKQNLDVMGQQKQAAYRAGMANVKADKSVLAFDGIDKAIDDAVNLTSFKGQSKNARASQAVQAAADEVQRWKQLDPAEFHTPEGLDALKQRLNGVLESIPFEEKTARKAVGNIYSSIKSEISKQAPEYSKVMQEYSTASETIKEIERALSLGNKAAADTSMRKLQSLMRNNVNTSYGYRDTLAKTMIDAGGNDIMPALAGQALNEFVPRGIQRATSGGIGGALALTGNLPAAAGMAAISSPRAVGEAMYGAGRLAGSVPSNALTEALRQGVYRGAPIVGAQ